jgi:hypothetical protein
MLVICNNALAGVKSNQNLFPLAESPIPGVKVLYIVKSSTSSIPTLIVATGTVDTIWISSRVTGVGKVSRIWQVSQVSACQYDAALENIFQKSGSVSDINRVSFMQTADI